MRRGVVWLMGAAVVAAGVFSLLGEPVLGAVYAMALVGVAGFHYAYSCRRCTNVSCAVNPRSPQFFLRMRPAPIRERAEDSARRPPEEDFSDLDARIAGLPLLAVVAFGLYGTFLYSPLAAAAVLAVLGLGAAGYSSVTCTGCGNECPANRNSAYRSWKNQTPR